MYTRSIQTHLAAHSTKLCDGEVTRYDAFTETWVVFVLQIDEQSANLRLVRGVGAAVVVEHSLLNILGTRHDLLARCFRRVSDMPEIQHNSRRDVRAPESKTSASYMSSAHLSRVLSPVYSIFTPSVFAERVSLSLEPDPLVDAVGVTGVDGVAAFELALADFFAAAQDVRRPRPSMNASRTYLQFCRWMPPLRHRPMPAFPAQLPSSIS